MRVAILQPGYLPWLGFFEQMARVDLFVYYNDVQYTKGDWRNRNRIKTASGLRWLTVPVKKVPHDTPINRVEISYAEPWPDKHLRLIAEAYRRAPYFEPMYSQLCAILAKKFVLLQDLNAAVTQLLCSHLAIDTPTRWSSDLGLTATGKNERLIKVCQKIGADALYDGAAAAAFIDEAMFAEAGIRVEFQAYEHPEYPQLHGEFVSHLSALDLVMNAGPAAGAILLGQEEECTTETQRRDSVGVG